MSERITWSGTTYRMAANYGALLLQVVYREESRLWQWSASFGGPTVCSMEGVTAILARAKACAVAAALFYLRQGLGCPFEYALTKGWITREGEPIPPTAAPRGPHPDAPSALGVNEPPREPGALLAHELERADSLSQFLLGLHFGELLELNSGAHPVLVVPARIEGRRQPLRWQLLELADLYDRAQAARGDGRRAVRS